MCYIHTTTTENGFLGSKPLHGKAQRIIPELPPIRVITARIDRRAHGDASCRMHMHQLRVNVHSMGCMHSMRKKQQLCTYSPEYLARAYPGHMCSKRLRGGLPGNPLESLFLLFREFSTRKTSPFFFLLLPILNEDPNSLFEVNQAWLHLLFSSGGS